MFYFFRGIALIAAVILNCGVAFAQDRFSANYKMVGCRAFLVADTQIPTIFDQGVCAGIVQGLPAPFDVIGGAWHEFVNDLLRKPPWCHLSTVSGRRIPEGIRTVHRSRET